MHGHSELLQFFGYEHLPVHLQDVSRRFHALAMWIVSEISESSEREMALRKLLEAKDCAVRAEIMRLRPTAANA